MKLDDSLLKIFDCPKCGSNDTVTNKKKYPGHYVRVCRNCHTAFGKIKIDGDITENRRLAMQREIEVEE